MGIIWESWLDPTFSLGVLVGRGISLAATTGQDGCNTFSHPTNFRALPSSTGSGMQCASGKSVVPGVCSSSLGRATPQKTSSLVKERYHFTSSLSSKTLLTNKCGSPLAGRLFCSAQCWRALTYTTTFSLGISQMSIHAKIELAGGINLFLWRTGGAGGACRVAFLESSSCNCCGSLKDALTSLASFLASSFPSTADSSIHQSGVSHLSAFHETHRLKSRIVGSGGVFSSSSSKVSSNIHRKEATISFSSCGSSKSEPLPSDPSSPGGVLGSADWLGAGSSANLTWWHLLFCPSPLSLWQSPLLDLALDCKQAQVQFSLLISFSRVDTVANAFWCASCTMAKLLSTELSFFLLWRALLLEEWEPPG